MKYTIIEMRVFETILAEIDELSRIVAVLYQSNGDKALEKWLTGQDVCQILNISQRTLQTYRETGTLPFSKIVRQFYYKPEDVQKLINSKEQENGYRHFNRRRS